MNFFCCKNLKKTYGQDIIFEKVNIDFPSFGIVSLIGQSGCGKSTLINCLLGLEKVDQGEIYFKGKKIKNFDDFRNRYCGVIFQSFHLFDYLSVKENILLFGRNSNFERIISLLELKGKLNQKVGLLSSGEKQRVAIARTLMKNPLIIFCDEITGSLDEKNGRKIMDYLKELSDKILIINVSHNLQLVKRYSSYIISLDRKEIDFTPLKEEKIRIKNKQYHLSFSRLLKVSGQLLSKSLLQLSIIVISLTLSFSMFSSVGLVKDSLNSYLKENYFNSLDYSFLELSVVTKNKIENTSFTLEKYVRPSDEDLSNIDYIIDQSLIKTNYSNLINSYTKLLSDNKEISLTFLPCESELITSYNQVIINDAASKIISNSVDYLLETSIDYVGKNNQVILDNLSLNINFEVVGINNENQLFQNPVIYYSYSLLEEYLYSIKLVNISTLLDRYISLAHRITYFTYEGDYFNTGSIYIYEDNKEKVMRIYEDINSLKGLVNFTCSNRIIDENKNLSTLLDSIFVSVNIFLFISVIIACFIFFVGFSSLLINQSKELAILQSLGVKSKQIYKISSYQIDLILLISYLLSFVFVSLLSFFITYKIKFIFFSSWSNILKQSFLVFILIYILSFIFKLFLLFIRRRIHLVSYLREN